MKYYAVWKNDTVLTVAPDLDYCVRLADDLLNSGRGGAIEIFETSKFDYSYFLSRPFHSFQPKRIDEVLPIYAVYNDFSHNTYYRYTIDGAIKLADTLHSNSLVHARAVARFVSVLVHELVGGTQLYVTLDLAQVRQSLARRRAAQRPGLGFPSVRNS